MVVKSKNVKASESGQATTSTRKRDFQPQTSEDAARVHKQEQQRAAAGASQSGLTFEGMRTEVSPEAHQQVQEAIRNNATSDQIRAILEANRQGPSTPAPQLTAAQEAGRQQRQQEINLREQEKQPGQFQVGGTTLDLFPFGEKGPAATVAKIALAGAAITGVVWLAGATSLGTGIVTTRGLSIPSVARSASGIFRATTTISRGAGGQITKNTVYASKGINYLMKVLSSTTFKVLTPVAAVGAVSSILFSTGFALNENNDALTTLSIRAGQAAKLKDTAQLQQILAEAEDIEQAMFTARGLAPYVGNYDAAKSKSSALVSKIKTDIQVSESTVQDIKGRTDGTERNN